MAEAAMEAAEAAAAAAAEAAMEASLGGRKTPSPSRALISRRSSSTRARRAPRPGRIGSPASLGAATPSERRLSVDAGAAADAGGPQLLSVAADDLRTLMDSVAALRAEQRASKPRSALCVVAGSTRDYDGWRARLRALARRARVGRCAWRGRRLARRHGGAGSAARRSRGGGGGARRALKDAREELNRSRRSMSASGNCCRDG